MQISFDYVFACLQFDFISAWISRFLSLPDYYDSPPSRSGSGTSRKPDFVVFHTFIRQTKSAFFGKWVNEFNGSDERLRLDLKWTWNMTMRRLINILRTHTNANIHENETPQPSSQLAYKLILTPRDSFVLKCFQIYGQLARHESGFIFRISHFTNSKDTTRHSHKNWRWGRAEICSTMGGRILSTSIEIIY